MDKVLGSVLDKIGSLTSSIRLRNDDDFIDRLNHRYTTTLLLIFTAVVSTKQYVGDPIHCWCPAEYKSTPYYEYINQVCWVSNTYYIPMEDTIPTNAGQRKEKELTYYQWVPMILLSMALLFKIPRILWKVLASSASFNLEKFITMVRDVQLKSDSERKEQLKDLVKYIQEWRENSRQLVFKNKPMFCGKRQGNFFMMSSVLVKLLYIVNAIVQFTMLNEFLGNDFLFGFEVMGVLSRGKYGYLRPSPRFPFVTLCDFQIRQLQNLQNWTIQCVLPINLFNEKIFLIIWLWLALISILSVINLLLTSYATMFASRRLHYIKKFLKLRHFYNSTVEENRILYKFVHSYLKFDGVYILRIAAHNGSDVLVAQIIETLYDKFKDTFIYTKHVNGELQKVKYDDDDEKDHRRGTLTFQH